MTQFPDPWLSWCLKGNVIQWKCQAETELCGESCVLTLASHFSASVSQFFNLYSGGISDISKVLSTVLGPYEDSNHCFPIMLFWTRMICPHHSQSVTWKWKWHFWGLHWTPTVDSTCFCGSGYTSTTVSLWQLWFAVSYKSLAQPPRWVGSTCDLWIILCE